jgi:hypothetical protein
MLMVDVRNAISDILDRYTLGDVVDVTLRKMRQDNATLPFMPEPAPCARPGRRIADPAQGFLSQLGIRSVLSENEAADGNQPEGSR